MAGSLWLLLDDLATVLDDVAVMTKVAAKKSAGVLGDDLALNAHQVSGVASRRELPVVWKVFVGSMLNKVILVPLFLLIVYFAPKLINPILLLGGLILCYEGAEKLLHKWLDKKAADSHEEQLHKAIETDADLVKLENEKIKGAIKTDFILSAEILAIALGTMALTNFTTVAIALSFIAIVFTIGVYGLVAAVVKLDDLGGYLVMSKKGIVLEKIGYGILAFAPKLMKFLSIAGTAAMFLVGGSIVLHVTPIGNWINGLFTPDWGVFNTVYTMSLDGVAGLISGAVCLAILHAVKSMRKKAKE